MAVPAHDERDYDFAQKYGIEIITVIDEDGKTVNSEEFSGIEYKRAGEMITQKLEEMGIGKKTINYRLRDWLISRQRYWGCPIPVVYCDDCGIVPVAESELPVMLPTDVKFTGKGESPLTTSDEFKHAVCPKCGKKSEKRNRHYGYIHRFVMVFPQIYRSKKRSIAVWKGYSGKMDACRPVYRRG